MDEEELKLPAIPRSWVILLASMELVKGDTNALALYETSLLIAIGEDVGDKRC